MNTYSAVQIATGLFLFYLISACSDDTRVTLHEAHIYKGSIDVHKTDAKTREKRLQQRALLVFSDR
jgi:hypothetical protein